MTEQAAPEAETKSGTPDEAAPVSLGAHLGVLIERRLHKLAQSLKTVYAEHGVEAVHDLRVASRRLRALGVVFADSLDDRSQTRLRRNLKRVAKTVGSLRDRDVQIELVAGRAARAETELERAGADYLLEQLDALRARGARRARKRLRRLDVEAVSRQVRRVARHILDELVPAREQRPHARALLERLVDDAALQVRSEGSERADELHQLRIDIKQLRYALELFEPLFGAHYGALYQRATELQDMLGAHRDLLVLCEALASEGSALARRGRRGLAAGVGAVEAALAAERRELFEKVRQQGFDAGWWREKLALAFAEP